MGALRVIDLLRGFKRMGEEKRRSISPISYLFTGEYEMPGMGPGPYVQLRRMAALIAPRPSRWNAGHNDGVGLDEWVAYEYAKVHRFYERLGIGEATTIEYFDGPHTHQWQRGHSSFWGSIWTGRGGRRPLLISLLGRSAFLHAVQCLCDQVTGFQVDPAFDHGPSPDCRGPLKLSCSSAAHFAVG